MRCIHLFFAIALGLGCGSADSAERHRNVLVVEDRAGADWSPIIAETVAEFSPYRPLRLVTKAKGCARPKHGHVVVCERSLGGDTLGATDGHRVYLTENDSAAAELREQIVCHEFMHAMTDIPDNYGARDDSCVWGWLPDLGDFDRAILLGGTW